MTHAYRPTTSPSTTTTTTTTSPAIRPPIAWCDLVQAEPALRRYSEEAEESARNGNAVKDFSS